jgi:hypothetical protein
MIGNACIAFADKYFGFSCSSEAYGEKKDKKQFHKRILNANIRNENEKL